MLYVKKVVTDLKPEDSGGSERKKFYVEELTKVFQDGKLTVGLFLAGIFYHFLQRTAKENVLISKVGVSAEVSSSLDFFFKCLLQLIGHLGRFLITEKTLMQQSLWKITGLKSVVFWPKLK